MTAGLILAIMITPIITSITREVFATVPRDQKEAALGLGATRWEMIRGAVLPHSRRHGRRRDARPRPGHGRDDRRRARDRLEPADHGQPVRARRRDAGGDRQPVRRGRAARYRAALIGLGVVLFVITIIVNLLARGSSAGPSAGCAEERD